MFSQTTCLDSFLKSVRSFTPMDSSADGPFWGPQTSYLKYVIISIEFLHFLD
jgi:hypothetical protein